MPKTGNLSVAVMDVMEIIGEMLSQRLRKSFDEEVTRSYVVGLTFPGETAQQRRERELFAAAIVLGYQQELYQKLTPERVQQACGIVKEQPYLSGTRGSASLRRELGDCSNLGEAAYLPLLQAIKGMFSQQEKLYRFFELLEGRPQELVSWFLYGRTPYGETLLQQDLHLSHKYVADLVLGARRALDTYLPPDQYLTAPYPLLTAEQLQQGLTRFYQQVNESIAQQQQQQQQQGTAQPTARQQTFLKKLTNVLAHQEQITSLLVAALAEWQHPQPTTPRSRWRHLQALSHQVAELLARPGQQFDKLAYFSVIRGLLVTALLPHYDDGRFVVQLQVQGLITAEKLIAKPFSRDKPSHERQLPVALLMGSQYVVGRPGNADTLTEVARAQGNIELTFWPYRKKKQSVTGLVMLHETLQTFLRQGAKITLLTLTVSHAPAYKLRCTITMTGTRSMFFTATEIHRLQADLASTAPPRLTAAPIRGVGVDVNRLGEHMLTCSVPATLPTEHLELIQRYKNLERTISELSRSLTRKKQHSKRHPSQAAHCSWLKVKGELDRVYARRQRLLQTIHRKAGQWLAALLLQTQTSILCIEDLHFTAKGTRGALAKIILSLPDEPDLFERACLVVEWLTNRSLILVLVDPRGTSQGEHVACPCSPKGKLQRTATDWDYARCTVCGQMDNTHSNSAQHICSRGLAFVAVYLPSSLSPTNPPD